MPRGYASCCQRTGEGGPIVRLILLCCIVMSLNVTTTRGRDNNQRIHHHDHLGDAPRPTLLDQSWHNYNSPVLGEVLCFFPTTAPSSTILKSIRFKLSCIHPSLYILKTLHTVDTSKLFLDKYKEFIRFTTWFVMFLLELLYQCSQFLQTRTIYRSPNVNWYLAGAQPRIIVTIYHTIQNTFRSTPYKCLITFLTLY